MVVGSFEEMVGGEMRGDMAIVWTGHSGGSVNLGSLLDDMGGQIGSSEVSGRARWDDDGKDESRAWDSREFGVWEQTPELKRLKIDVVDLDIFFRAKKGQVDLEACSVIVRDILDLAESENETGALTSQGMSRPGSIIGALSWREEFDEAEAGRSEEVEVDVVAGDEGGTMLSVCEALALSPSQASDSETKWSGVYMAGVGSAKGSWNDKVFWGLWAVFLHFLGGSWGVSGCIHSSPWGGCVIEVWEWVVHVGSGTATRALLQVILVWSWVIKKVSELKKWD